MVGTRHNAIDRWKSLDLQKHQMHRADTAHVQKHVKGRINTGQMAKH